MTIILPFFLSVLKYFGEFRVYLYF